MAPRVSNWAAGHFAHIDFRLALEPYHALISAEGDGNVRLHIYATDACINHSQYRHRASTGDSPRRRILDLWTGAQMRQVGGDQFAQYFTNL
jgi:hypothetical protein